MVNIRRLVMGVDEPVLVDVLNAAHIDSSDWRAITLEEFLQTEQAPGFDFGARFIAELDGRPVGLVQASVEREGEDEMGVIRFGVVPEFRGQGVEQLLVETGLRELQTSGTKTARVWVEGHRKDQMELLERLGFRVIRVYSTMVMDLTDVSHNIGENSQVLIRPLDKSSEQDIELVNRLYNECFGEHFGYRPDTLEETRHQILDSTFVGRKEFFFAMLDSESVGYLGFGIDEKYNQEKNVKAGEILTIGVLPGYRRRGIGTRLVIHCLETLRTRGMTRAEVGVDDDNPTEAVGLYERVGFTVATKDSIYERELSFLE